MPLKHAVEQNVARADMTAGQRSLNEQIIVTRDISAGVQVAGELDAAADDAAIGDDSASAGNALDMNIAGTSHCTIVDNQLIAGNGVCLKRAGDHGGAKTYIVGECGTGRHGNEPIISVTYVPCVAGVVMQDTSCALRTASAIIVDELMLTFALWVYGNRTGVSRESALDKEVDLILLAHDDELIVAMHDQFLGTVLEFLAGGLDVDHGHTVLVMHLHILDVATHRVQRGVNLHDVVWAVDFDVIQIVASHQMTHALAGIGFRIDDMVGANALQNAGVLLRDRFGPQVGDAGIQQVAGDDYGSLDRQSLRPQE